MYIFSNALKNLKRNSGRNVMIGAIIFAIILTTVIALTIHNTADAVIQDYQERFGSEVFIRADFEKIRENAMQNSTGGRFAMRLPQLSAEMYLSFADSEYLKESLATGSAHADSKSIKAIDQSEEEADSGSSGPVMGYGGGRATMIGGGGMNYRLLGDNWQDFTDGLRNLESGAFPQHDNECIVSSDLRDLNDLKIGDVITLTSTANVDVPADLNPLDYEDGESVTINGVSYNVTKMDADLMLLNREAIYELTVVGVYDDLNDAYPNEMMSGMAALNRRNEILTTLGTLLNGRYENEGGVEISASYFLKEPGLLDDFEAEIRAKGLTDMFNVETDTAAYDRVVKPVSGLKGISITFMVVVLVLGAIILLLLASISIRERKYEIGILRAMGMKKYKIAIGLLTEIFAITCICLVLGIGVGIVAAQPVSDMLLKNQAEASSEQGGPMQGGMMMMNVGGAMIGGGSSNAQPLSEMEISLGFITILEIIGISVLLATFAGLISVSRITKYEPIKILMERN